MTGIHTALTDAEARHLIATALDTTLIVEAAAGTGKTTALVERIVQMIAEGRAEVGEIVAVTFTEKAAGELKLRLRERLDNARMAASKDEDQENLPRTRLNKALRQLEEAHVGTIHAFCADLLRERPVEAGVDPLFEVLTEPASARLFDEAFGRWLQDELSDPGEGVRRALRRSAFGGEDGPVDRLKKAAWELAQWRDFTAPWTRRPFDREAEIDSVVSLLHELAELTRNPSSRNDPLFTGTDPVRRLSDEIRLQQTFGDAGPQEALSYDGWESGLVDLSRDRTLANTKQGRGASYRDGVPRERVVAALTGLRARLDQLRMDADADLAALLQQELRGALDRYAAMKATAGALDFLDLLLTARNLVRDNRQVREGFQLRFKRIFVDEFQDTDPLQAEILLLLSADDPGEADWRLARPVPGRLFLVGDPKQSIYRFRRADVAIYRDVCRRLQDCGATFLHLTTSFRSVPEIQALVNTAFAPVMTGDDITLQADYVPLGRHRPAIPGQPSLVALPVPEPYARKYISGRAIEQSLPDAVGAFVDWVINQSKWQVTERSGSAPVKVAAKHICLLFRRFVSWEADVTRPYVEALETRGIAHVLVGGRAFHEREEVEALRAALTAIEWPDDELSVFATLRGPFFAIGDEELLEWAHRFGHRSAERVTRGVFHPFRVPAIFDENTPEAIAHLRPIAEALWLLQRLHRHRNYVLISAFDRLRPTLSVVEGSGLGGRAEARGDLAREGGGLGARSSERTAGGVSGTLQELLSATRAHVGFALRTGGEQALANVLHIAELARQYEMGGGISFRGFVEELRLAADTAQASEAPILEEDSDGVRMMTVHKAKGLEFPIVILADLTCRLSRPDAGRWIDPTGRLCALKLGGWAPADLLLHGYEEAARDKAEGERLAYVAATRARDVLVVPTVGDEVYEGGWLDPLMPAVYPSLIARQARTSAPGCPQFVSKDSVLTRPDGDPARPMTVSPGLYTFAGQTADLEPEAPSPPPSRADSPRASARPRRSLSAGSLPTSEGGRASGNYSVVWWDPHALSLHADSGYGLRRDDLIAKDGDPAKVAARLAEYRQWQADRERSVAKARVPSMTVRTATALAVDRTDSLAAEMAAPVAAIEIIEVPRSADRPFGPRFGTLVHAALATVPLDATDRVIATVANAQSRIIPTAPKDAYAEEEVSAAVEVVTNLFRSPLFERVRAADRAGRCERELPICWKSDDGTLIEGTIDLVFEDVDGLTVIDFKTDRELVAGTTVEHGPTRAGTTDEHGPTRAGTTDDHQPTRTRRYTRQLEVYCRALSVARGTPVRGILMRI
jgi:ATP-dependent helicase/nuclease subunit A